MTEPIILNIETATNVCSVALSKGQMILASRETHEDRSHGTVLTPFIEQVLDEAMVAPEDVNAVAVSKGPGSYTGLRIGVSVAKGFAFARDIPVIGIPTLELLAVTVRNQKLVEPCREADNPMFLCPMIDARRMEVFTAIYSPEIKIVEQVCAKIIEPDTFKVQLNNSKLLFFGNGSTKIKTIITHPNACFLQDVFPLAQNMVPMAVDSYIEKRFEDTAYFEPFYLKDFIATIPRKKVL